MRYTKVATLRSGQFGVVYKAIDIDTGRFLAVKILKQPV
jgi:serine/threonine protein kinase